MDRGVEQVVGVLAVLLAGECTSQWTPISPLPGVTDPCRGRGHRVLTQSWLAGGRLARRGSDPCRRPRAAQRRVPWRRSPIRRPGLRDPHLGLDRCAQGVMISHRSALNTVWTSTPGSRSVRRPGASRCHLATVADHHPLGHTGRARGVDHVGQVGRIGERRHGTRRCRRHEVDGTGSEPRRASRPANQDWVSTREPLPRQGSGHAGQRADWCPLGRTLHRRAGPPARRRTCSTPRSM